MEEKRFLKTAKLEDITKKASQGTPKRLIALIILRALAMALAGLQGKKLSF